MALLTFSSSLSQEEARKAVEATVKWATGSANARLDDASAKAFSDARFQLWIYGGGWPDFPEDKKSPSPEAKASDGNQPAFEIKSIDAFKKYLTPSGKTDVIWGVPIGYRAEYLGTRQSVVVNLTTT